MTAALATGDTMSHTIRTSAVRALGQTDEMVSPKGADRARPSSLGGDRCRAGRRGRGGSYRRCARRIESCRRRHAGHHRARGHSDPAQKANEPRVTLFASDPARMSGFGEIQDARGGGALSLDDLHAGEVFLNEKAADELLASAGDEVTVFIGQTRVSLMVRDIVRYDGAGTDDLALLMPIAPPRSCSTGRARSIMSSSRTVATLCPAQACPTRSSANSARSSPRWASRRKRRNRTPSRRPTSGRRLHRLVHDLRLLLDRRGDPPHLPNLRDAGSGEARRARDRTCDRNEARPSGRDVRVRGSRIRPRSRAGRGPARCRGRVRNGHPARERPRRRRDRRQYSITARSLAVAYALGVLITLVVVASLRGGSA